MLQVNVFAPERYFGSNCYVLHSGGEYCVIDPSAKYESVAERLGDIKGKIKYIILTHCHFDHVLTLEDWIENTGVHPTASKECISNLADSGINCYKTLFRRDVAYSGKSHAVTEADMLTLGDEKLTFIMTPGHTSGSVTVAASDYLFVGDLIFAEGMRGRCDLPTGDDSVIIESINRILSLDGGLIIMPGHGESTTVLKARGYDYI